MFASHHREEHPWEAAWNVNWMVVSWIVALALLALLAWAAITGGTRRR
jgi:hypothetical protein